MLPVGQAQAHHAGMFSPQALRRLITEAKKHFEIILIDSGPVPSKCDAYSGLTLYRLATSPTVKLPGTPVAADIAAIDLPLYGRIAAGTPIEALRDQSSSVAVPGSLIGRGEHYALEVAGDSMVDAGIFDGDTVIIERADTADNGEIVVALVDNEEVTLKRLRRRGASIALEPANQTYETRIFGPDRVKVQGRLVGLMRRY